MPQELEPVVVLSLFAMAAICLLVWGYGFWCMLLANLNRKEKDGFFVNEIGSEHWGRLMLLGLVFPAWFNPWLYTERGNRYRRRGLVVLLIGALLMGATVFAGLAASGKLPVGG